MNPVWMDEVIPWVAERIEGCERGFAEARGLAVLDGSGRVCAGVVFHDWSPERGLIELSAAATNPMWLTRNVAKAVMTYVFSVARMAIVRTSEKNTRVRRIWRALGGVEHVIPDLWADGEAGVVVTLREDQWKESRLCNEQA